VNFRTVQLGGKSFKQGCSNVINTQQGIPIDVLDIGGHKSKRTECMKWKDFNIPKECKKYGGESNWQH
jgi:hypothetical protein